MILAMLTMRKSNVSENIKHFFHVNMVVMLAMLKMK